MWPGSCKHLVSMTLRQRAWRLNMGEVSHYEKAALLDLGRKKEKLRQPRIVIAGWQALTGTELWLAPTPQGKPPLRPYHMYLVTCVCPVNLWALMPTSPTPPNHWLSTFLGYEAPFSTEKKNVANPWFRSLCFPPGREIFKGRHGVRFLFGASLGPSTGTRTQGAVRKLPGWRGRDSYLITSYHYADLEKSSINRVLRKESTSLDLNIANPSCNWTEGLPVPREILKVRFARSIRRIYKISSTSTGSQTTG